MPKTCVSVLSPLLLRRGAARRGCSGTGGRTRRRRRQHGRRFTVGRGDRPARQPLHGQRRRAHDPAGGGLPGRRSDDRAGEQSPAAMSRSERRGGGAAPTTATAGVDSTSSDYGPTMYGSAADDDDCKYFVSWTATPIKENADTYFTVTALRLADMAPASCAGIRPDVSLSITHGAPAPRESRDRDRPRRLQGRPHQVRRGRQPLWTVRFHLFEECSDSREDSPHGHAAFYVKVP